MEELSKSTERKLAGAFGARLHEEDDQVSGQSPKDKQPPATVRGEGDEVDEAEMTKILRSMAFDLKTGRLTLKEFDDIIAQVFKPQGQGSSNNFTNRLSPGTPEPKRPAKPGQSGSSTGQAGSGTSTYPGNESGSHDDTGHSYSNPTSVDRGSGATTGNPRDFAHKITYDAQAPGPGISDVGYDPRLLGKAVAEKAQSGTDLEAGSPAFESFFKNFQANAIKRAKFRGEGKFDYEDDDPVQPASTPPATMGLGDEEAYAGPASGNSQIQMEDEAIVSGLPTSAQRYADEEAATRFDEEAEFSEAEAKRKEKGIGSSTGPDLRAAKDLRKRAELARQNARILRNRAIGA